MRLEKITGFVVYAFPLGEADQLVSCFSSSGNLVKFIAKGSRKTKSRFAAAVQLFNLGEYVIYRGKGLPILRQADIIDSFLSVRRDWSKTGAAMATMELCRLLIVDEARETEVFQLVFAYLHHLKESEYSPLVFDSFRLQFAARLGYAMDFSKCGSCGGDPGNNPGLNWSGGGAVCSRCRTESRNPGVKTDTLRILDKMQTWDFSKIAEINYSTSQRRNCTGIADSLIFWLTEGKTKAQAFRSLFEEGS